MAKADDQDGSEVACRGTYGQVHFARVVDGSRPAKEFFDSLTEAQQAGFAVLFQKVVSNPTLVLQNREQFKQVEGQLYEFKKNNYQMRMFTFRDGQIWYLVHGIRGKKEDELEPGDVKRAKELMEQARRVLKGKR